MPRAKSAPLFELSGHWIAAEPGRRNLYHFWPDARSGRTCRASLGTADLEKAKPIFAARVLKGAPKTPDSLLSAVLLQYYTERTDKLPSRKQSRNAGRVVLKAFGAAVRVGELTNARQKQFAEWSLARGFRLSYVVKNMTVVKAALNHCEVAPPSKIITVESYMRERWGLADAKPPRRAYIPTDAELVRILAHPKPERLTRWIVLMLLTNARPEAALDLAPAARRRDAGLIALNPEDRVQNKKHRPIVRVPRVLRVHLDAWERLGLAPYGGRYCGYTTVAGVDSAIERLRDDVGLPKLSTYSFRHKVTSVLRSRGVHEDQVSMMLGHRRPDLRTTAGYGEFAPDYLADAAAALDSWFLTLRRKLKSHRSPASISLQTKRAA